MVFQLLQTDRNHIESSNCWQLKKVDNLQYRSNINSYLAKIITTIGINGLSQQVCCQGSRQGMEPYFFSKLLRCYSYGTDISPTSEFFPNVEQHDFHKTLKSKVDIIFSNSYDQSSNPDALAEAWVDSINEKGLIVLQYGEGHKPEGINELDPFGVSKKGLHDLFNKVIQNKRIESSFLWVKDLPRQIKMMSGF